MNRVFGIPNFWLTVMKRKDILAELITEDDEGALQYLEDIKSCRLDDSGGFMLEFSFSCTPYFKNSKLEKKYKIDRDGPVLIKARGCVIRDEIIPYAVSWFTGQFTDKELFVKYIKMTK
ncbi:hypothetical protein LR48_Vigan05g200400 [Vigna angularis]|uniref:Uncharacterized protein n=1 Tax=Phaseolus angularis TaxID=3914 RepID=A0A0L9UPC9_PHAAN|nr:hypothetical protein LR48_Vigan05g200400 [Vigna angularis]